MPSGKATPVERWSEYLALRRQGESIWGASKKINLSYHACRDAEAGQAPRNYVAAQEILGALVAPHVPEEEELCPEAKEALDNIAVFARRYFGIVLQPWQVEATEKIFGLLETEY